MDLQIETHQPEAAISQYGHEQAFVARLKRADDEAYAELVKEHAGRLLATARRLLRDDAAAEDVVQKTFISAFNAIGAFSGNARLSTWLHRIAVNHALMKIRSERRRPEESIDELLPRFDDEGAWADARSSSAALSPESYLMRRQVRAAVRSAIDELPPSYRAVIVLRDIEELDTEETALAMGITPAAVKVRLHRARQALKTLLENELAEA